MVSQAMVFWTNEWSERYHPDFIIEWNVKFIVNQILSESNVLMDEKLRQKLTEVMILYAQSLKEIKRLTTPPVLGGRGKRSTDRR